MLKSAVLKNFAIFFLGLSTLLSLVTAAYFYGRFSYSSQPTQPTQPTQQLDSEPTQQEIAPTVAPISVMAQPSNSPSSLPVQRGKLTGKLCYPSSFVPNGVIIAKNTSTQELFKQEYPGSLSGADPVYTLDLPKGEYRVKFEANISGSTITGFYTLYAACVDDSTLSDCSGVVTRPTKVAVVKPGETTTHVHLCDFYYPENQPPAF